MSKGNIGRTVQNGRRGLIQNGGSRLLNEASLLVLPLIVITLPRHVEPFGGTWLVSREVVPLEKNWTKNGVVGVDARVNESHNSRTADPETILSVLQPNDLGCGLRRIPMPDYRAVVIDRRGVRQTRGNAGQMRLRNQQETILLNADDPKERFDQVQRAIDNLDDQILGRGHQVGLADLAIQRSLNLTTEEIAKI